MCVGGLPLRNKSNPIDTVLAGLEMQQFVDMLNKEKIKKGINISAPAIPIPRSVAWNEPVYRKIVKTTREPTPETMDRTASVLAAIVDLADIAGIVHAIRPHATNGWTVVEAERRMLVAHPIPARPTNPYPSRRPDSPLATFVSTSA